MTQVDLRYDTGAATAPPTRDALGELAERAGLQRVHLLAWRDLDDDEAGGSELHASTIAARWADAGIDVTIRTSAARQQAQVVQRDGYRVVRKGGRYVVFPRTAVSTVLGRGGRHDGLVEIWNGMPFLSPLWGRGPRIVFLHHVHADMWRMVIRSRLLSRAGELLELRLAPHAYRGTPIVTLSQSSRLEINRLLGLALEDVTVVPPGIDHARFSPGGPRSPHPLVVAVGRLVPVKRFDRLVDALVELRGRHPLLEAVIAGEGYERPALEARIRAADAQSWLHLPGRVDDDELVALYRRAWAVASSSTHEGWGMTLTEAAACGTPAVASRIAGHLDAVVHGETGYLANDQGAFVAQLDRVLSNPVLRESLGRGARAHAERFTWDATAYGTLGALAADAFRRRRLLQL